MNDLDTSLRLMVILAQADSDSFDTSATAAGYAAAGVDITLVTTARGQRGRSGSLRESYALREVVSLESVDGELEQVEPEQIICELVAHIRRVQPHVVITSGPFDGFGDADRLAISQFATAAVMRAPDPRYGHTCCSRRRHTVSKLYYTATASRSRHASAHASLSQSTRTIEHSVSSTADESSKATCSKVCGSTTLTSQSLRERTDWTYRPRENAG
jgi:LmbE family N-acetylglucosaminyl deacetylase